MTHSSNQRSSGPFEITLLVFIFTGRLASLLSNDPPGIVDKLLGERLIAIWSVLLLLGPAVAVLGILWRGSHLTALAIEQAGLILVSGAAFIYAAVLLTQSSKAEGVFTTTAFVAGYGIASIWRIIQIYRIQREHIQQSEALDEGTE